MKPPVRPGFPGIVGQTVFIDRVCYDGGKVSVGEGQYRVVRTGQAFAYQSRIYRTGCEMGVSRLTRGGNIAAHNAEYSTTVKERKSGQWNVRRSEK